MIEVFANLATTTLAGPISAGALSVNLAAGTGALFPNPTPGASYFLMTFIDAATRGVTEIVQVTARSTDACTIVRGQEGTAAAAWLAGDFADNRWTAGSAAIMVQVAQLQQQAGNYAADTGSANAYVVTLNPVPSSLAFLTGVPIRVKIAATNTGNSTLAVNGLATTTIKNPDLTTLAAGQLVAGSIVEVFFDGTQFQLAGPASYHPGFSNIQAFTSSGTFTVPAGVTRIKVRVWGGGGGGGGVNGASAQSSGGSGAGYSEGIFAVTPGAVLTVAIGAPGTGGSIAPTNGTSGGTTSVSGCNSATGGGPGFASSSGGQATTSTPGSGSGGTINLGGTSGSGSLTNGGGSGGGSPFGAPSSPAGSIGGTGSGGTVPGGAGAGTACISGAFAGGPGGGGMAIIEY